MVDIVIATKGGFEVVDGYKVNKDFGAHKSENDGYVITDLASGLKVFGGLATIAAAKDKVKNMTEEEKQTLATKRQSDRYNDFVTKKKAWVADNVPDQCDVE